MDTMKLSRAWLPVPILQTQYHSLLNGACRVQAVQLQGYGLDDRGSIPGHRVQASSGADTGFYPMDTGGSFPEGLKRPGREADHSPLPSAEVKMSAAVPPPPMSSWRGA
jgi:hypothetical protein